MDERERRIITRMVQTLPRILLGLLILAVVALALILSACTYIHIAAPVTNSHIDVTASVVAQREKAERKTLAERLHERTAKTPPE